MADTLKKRVAPANGKHPAPKQQEEPTPDHPLAKCKPRGNRVVVRRDIAKDRATKGGILLPDSFANDKQQTGTVWSVGPGKLGDDGNYTPIDLTKGQRVIITGWAGLEVKDVMGSGNRDDEFVLLNEDDVVATLPDA